MIGEEVDKGVPVDTAIKKFGFTEARETRGLKTFFNARNTVLAPQMANLAAASAPGAGDRAMADIDAAMKGDVGRASIGRAETEIAKFEAGQRGKELAIAKLETEKKAVAEDQSPFAWVRRNLRKAVTLGNVEGRDIEIEEQAVQDAARAARSAVPHRRGDDMGARAASVLSSFLGPMASQVGGRAAGGLMAPSFSAMNNDNADVLNQLRAIAANTKAAASGGPTGAASGGPKAAQPQRRAPEVLPGPALGQPIR